MGELVAALLEPLGIPVTFAICSRPAIGVRPRLARDGQGTACERSPASGWMIRPSERLKGRRRERARVNLRNLVPPMPEKLQS